MQGPSPFLPASNTIRSMRWETHCHHGTGGNTGLGLESGKRLAAAGASVVLTSRSVAKGQKAVDSVQEYLAEKGIVNNNIYTVPLDLCDLASVKEFPSLLQNSKAFKESQNQSIDVLLNNAGVMDVPDLQ